MTNHITKTNPTGEVRQCSSVMIHKSHEWQAEFGAYFNVLCLGNTGHPPGDIPEVADETNRAVPDKETTFAVGDRVRKHSGYRFYGWVVAAFYTREGKTRYVVENMESIGMLHIFNGSQLEMILKGKKE